MERSQNPSTRIIATMPHLAFVLRGASFRLSSHQTGRNLATGKGECVQPRGLQAVAEQRVASASHWHFVVDAFREHGWQVTVAGATYETAFLPSLTSWYGGQANIIAVPRRHFVQDPGRNYGPGGFSGPCSDTTYHSF